MNCYEMKKVIEHQRKLDREKEIENKLNNYYFDVKHLKEYLTEDFIIKKMKTSEYITLVSFDNDISDKILLEDKFWFQFWKERKYEPHLQCLVDEFKSRGFKEKLVVCPKYDPDDGYWSGYTKYYVDLYW